MTRVRLFVSSISAYVLRINRGATNKRKGCSYVVIEVTIFGACHEAGLLVPHTSDLLLNAPSDQSNAFFCGFNAFEME